CFDGVEGEALQRLLVRAHDAVIGVVEADLEVQPADPGAAVECAGVLRPVQGAADLGGYLEFVARAGAQETTQAVLGQPATIPRGGVVVADTGIPGSIER